MIRVAIVDDHVIVRTGLRYLIDSDPELEFAGEDGALGYVKKESPIETIRAAIRSAMAGEVFMTEDVRRGLINAE